MLPENSRPISVKKCKPGAENIKVFIRIRPLSTKEVEKEIPDITLCNYEQNILALKKPEGEQTKTFKFDGIFGPSSDQGLIYKMVAMPVVEQVLEGYNGTIFAYGQTGTGKTYTMSGANENSECQGIIPNTFSHIFTHIAQASKQKSFTVTVAYVEIYNEELNDLLAKDKTKKLQIRERPDIGVYVSGLSGFTVKSVDAITELLNIGNRSRVTRSTLMNDVSSRSHAIFSIIIDTKDLKTEKSTSGKLNLVDLAGSERASRTQATGERLREAGSINQSLSTLGQVISSLAEDNSNSLPPFRNSKLTRLLTNSLGGNSKTSMIAMLSPAEIDYEETLCTLRYAQRAKHIKNHAVINVSTEVGIMAQFQKELDLLTQRLSIINEQEHRMKARKVKHERNQEFEQEKQRIQQERQLLQEKIDHITNKIIIGGENLIDKVKQQEFLLMSSGKELEQLDKSHQELTEQLSKYFEEKIDIEEKYTSLQDEDAALSKKLKKIQQLIKEAKEEYADKEQEYQRETQALTDNNRLLNRESQLTQAMIDSYIPPEYMNKIEQNLIFNGETQEYQMRGVAYTGNNMRKRRTSKSDLETPVRWEIKNPYHKYADKKREKSKEKRSLLKSYTHIPQTRSEVRLDICLFNIAKGFAKTHDRLCNNPYVPWWEEEKREQEEQKTKKSDNTTGGSCLDSPKPSTSYFVDDKVKKPWERMTFTEMELELFHVSSSDEDDF